MSRVAYTHIEREVTYNPCKELLCAVVLQAVKDLDSKSDAIRYDAEGWLLGSSSFLPDGLGKKIVEEHRNGKSKERR